MRKSIATLALLLAAAAVVAVQDPRISEAEQVGDKITADTLYDRQRQRDQAEADRVAKTNLDRQADYELYVARQKAEHEARMAKWQADVAKQKADHAARVAKCIADKTCAPQ